MLKIAAIILGILAAAILVRAALKFDRRMVEAGEKRRQESLAREATQAVQAHVAQAANADGQ